MHPTPTGTRAITPRDLVDAFGSTESWWIRQRPAMVAAGLLTKFGRRFFGDISAIEGALASGDWTRQAGE